MGTIAASNVIRHPSPAAQPSCSAHPIVPDCPLRARPKLRHACRDRRHRTGMAHVGLVFRGELARAPGREEVSRAHEGNRVPRARRLQVPERQVSIQVLEPMLSSHMQLRSTTRACCHARRQAPQKDMLHFHRCASDGILPRKHGPASGNETLCRAQEMVPLWHRL